MSNINGNNGKFTLRDLNRIIEEQNIKFVDFKFPDLLGSLQHITIPIEAFDEKMFIQGIGFDGSSIRGFQLIHESDMLIRPELETMFIDPFMDDPTISFLCNIKDPITQKIYTRDTRAVAQRADLFLEANHLADQAFFGPELEFFIFDEIHLTKALCQGIIPVDARRMA